MADNLRNLKVAVLATDGFEESELTEPVRVLREAGAQVEVLSPKGGEIQAFKHHDKTIKVKVDGLIGEKSPDDYDALLLPGGALNADALRVLPEAQRFALHFDENSKPIAVICHGPWLLVSSGIAQGRKLTSYHTIKDDLVNAGADWTDQKVVVDDNLVSSRQPDDLPDFNREMVELFGRGAQRKAA